MGGVQEPLFVKALLVEQGSPKVQYSARGSFTTWELRKKSEKMCGKTKLQDREKKTACAKREFQETTNVSPALAYQKLGCLRRKFHAESRSRPRFARRHLILHGMTAK